MIVSLTSYPARMGTLHLVLKSLYAQSMKPDKIILWLAGEQFPNKEADLPLAIVEDIKANRLDVRWCENLGSHKKYFFAMQEFPDKVIVTVDDDILYDPQMLETLYESYRRHPKAVSAHRVSLLLFDEQGNLLPCSRWILPYEALKDTPSLQLMAIGSRGILYPPGIIEQNAFDKDAIREHCKTNETIFLNDSWLKIHELAQGVPVVCVKGANEGQSIPKAQKVALKQSAAKGLAFWKAEKSLWLNMLEHEKLKQGILTIKNNPNWIPLEEDAVFNNVACKLRLLAEKNEVTQDQIIQTLSTSVRELNRQKAFGVSHDKWDQYIYEYQSILQCLSGAVELSAKTIPLYALKDYGFVLHTNLYGNRFNNPLQYSEMLASWEHFFMKHSDCDAVYREGHKVFLQNKKKADFKQGIWSFLIKASAKLRGIDLLGNRH